MKLPVISGKDAVKAFGKLGFCYGEAIRQPYSNEASIR